MSPPRPRVGISACLLGDRVRYDGGHKRDAYLVETLGAHVDWVPVCPEAELGLGVPRPPIRLEKHGDDVFLRVVDSGSDLTDRMARWAADRGAELGEQGLCGFVLKARSPSCGLDDAPVTDRAGGEASTRSGAFANDLAIAWPSLPLASEATLADPPRRAAFLSRLFAHASLAAADAPPSLRAHHERHRLLVASRDVEAVSLLDALAREGELESYADGFHAALCRIPRREDHVRALRFACMRAGERLRADARSAVATVLDAFTAGSASLATAIEVVRDAVPDTRPDDAYLWPAAPVFEAYRAL